MPDAKSWYGKSFFPRIWMMLCNLWLIVAVGALVMNFVVWLMIIIKNTRIFQDELGTYLGNDKALYGGSPESGYVDNTNIPKHLGGVVFAAVLAIAMMIFILIALAADVFIKTEVAVKFLSAFFTDGLYTTETDLLKIEFFFLIANAFLKLFIVVVTGSESYIGLETVGAPEIDTPLFCLYAVMILLGSIPITVIAEIFIISDKRRPAANKKYTGA
ncbi:hypothetical protein M231_03582 [Tremella mesenterica]|uniref:Uncharacterized protein n=1 Tax=Tremella mesenterica TaxID=5217 RepID=A0A4V1M444_TREME|nr:hypothetical protein M231_03582 [Tremella mesenterica]